MKATSRFEAAASLPSLRRMSSGTTVSEDEGSMEMLFLSRHSYTVYLLFQAFGGWKGIFPIALFLVLVYLTAAMSGGSIVHITLSIALASFTVSTINEVQTWSSRCGIDSEMTYLSADPATQPFLLRMFDVSKHHKDPHREVWRPRLSIDDVRRRGLCTVGVSNLRSIRDKYTWIIEYKLQALLRVLKVDLGIGRYSKEFDPRDTYNCIINSSLACFIEKATDNVVMYDTWLYYRKNQKKCFQKITLELDHENETCTTARLLRDAADPDSELTIKERSEIGAIVVCLIALKSHGSIHYIANGVAELESVWPLAKESNKMTQSLNYGAIFSGQQFISDADISVDVHVDVLGHNLIDEGLPTHRHLASLSEKSMTLKMVRRARPTLVKQLAGCDYTKERLEKAHAYAEALLAATIHHSADHYYPDQFLGYMSRSSFLETDLTILRTTLMPPNHYHSIRVLCRQHLQDPICCILYKAAYDVDPVFADTALFIGSVN